MTLWVLTTLGIVVLTIVRRQAAARMLVVDPDAEGGLLIEAEHARPAFVVSELLLLSAFATLALAMGTGGVVLWITLGALVLTLTLVLPVPLPRDTPGRAPVGVRMLGRLLGRRAHTPVGTAAATPRRETVDPLDERVLADRMLRFGETEITEIMVPRSDMVAISRDADLDELLAIVEEHRHSRYPVYVGDEDRITGYVSVFDLLALDDDERSFAAHVRPVLMVPEGKQGPELLTEMVEGGHEFAVVVDEYGGTSGVVTTEDLVEEMIGEIWDEHEREAVRVRRIGRDVYVSDATIPLDELSERIGLTLPEGDYETLAGFLLEEFGRIPTRGDRVAWDGAEFEVLTASRRRIESVQIVVNRKVVR